MRTEPMAISLLKWLLELAELHPIQFSTLFAIMSLAGIIGASSVLLGILSACTGITHDTSYRELSTPKKFIMLFMMFLQFLAKDHFHSDPRLLPPTPLRK